MVYPYLSELPWMTTLYSNREREMDASSQVEAAGGLALSEVLQMCAIIPDPVLIACHDEIVHVNAECCRMLTAEDSSALLGLRVGEVIVGALRDAGNGALPAQKRSTAMRLDGTMLEIERRSGRVPWDGVDATMMVLREELDSRAALRHLRDQVRSLAMTMETTSTRHLEITKELHHAKEVADLANRSKSEFLANMSHELRTPLNAIMGFSEIIKNELFGQIPIPQYVEYARDIHVSGSHLLDIINDILDLSKVEAGRFELHEEEVSIKEILGAVHNLIKGRLEEKDHNISFQIAPDFPKIRGDKRALKQILLNLLSNSVKFMEQSGSVVVTARLANNMAEIVVADNGIGIAPEDMKKVLSPFGQVDSALARDHQGTGLGLPLVQAMVQMHGGRLSLHSALGEGTTVKVVLPRERLLVAKPV